MASARVVEPATLMAQPPQAAMVGGGGHANNAFVSMASELVDEAKHPLEQLDALDKKAIAFKAKGDADAVVECRIKQKALNQVLVYLYDFPLQPLILSQAALAEAYAQARYHKQALEHLTQAREMCARDIYDDAQVQRLQVDLSMAEAVVQMSREQYEPAQVILREALMRMREVYGEWDARAVRIHSMIGEIARQHDRYADAAGAYEAAWEVQEYLDNAGGEASGSFSDKVESEETLRLFLKLAEVEHLRGNSDAAIEHQRRVVSKLLQQNQPQHALLFVDSSSQLARWLEAQGQDRDALEALQDAERIITEHLGAEDAKAVDVKRDAALLHLKLGDHETALQYLNDVHYYERRLHGSQSTNVARTLKALGTVHLVRRNLEDAEQHLLQALRIFEADHPQHANIVKDIHAKLGSISAMARGVA